MNGREGNSVATTTTKLKVENHDEKYLKLIPYRKLCAHTKNKCLNTLQKCGCYLHVGCVWFLSFDLSARWMGKIYHFIQQCDAHISAFDVVVNFNAFIPAISRSRSIWIVDWMRSKVDVWFILCSVCERFGFFYLCTDAKPLLDSFPLPPSLKYCESECWIWNQIFTRCA